MKIIHASRIWKKLRAVSLIIRKLDFIQKLRQTKKNLILYYIINKGKRYDLWKNPIIYDKKKNLTIFILNPNSKGAFSRAAETDRLSDKKNHVTTFVAELYSDNFYTWKRVETLELKVEAT